MSRSDPTWDESILFLDQVRGRGVGSEGEKGRREGGGYGMKGREGERRKRGSRRRVIYRPIMTRPLGRSLLWRKTTSLVVSYPIVWDGQDEKIKYRKVRYQRKDMSFGDGVVEKWPNNFIEEFKIRKTIGLHWDVEWTHPNKSPRGEGNLILIRELTPDVPRRTRPEMDREVRKGQYTDLEIQNRDQNGGGSSQGTRGPYQHKNGHI